MIKKLHNHKQAHIFKANSNITTLNINTISQTNNHQTYYISHKSMIKFISRPNHYVSYNINNTYPILLTS
jgi:hypothetical protein